MGTANIKPGEWLNTPPNEQEHIVETIAAQWRKRGFPHYNLTIEQRIKEFTQLQNYDRTQLIQDGVIKQTLHALGMAWHYFPHHWEVQIGKMKTAIDVWNNDELFNKAIKSRLKWGGYQINENGTPDISPAYMRKALRTYSGVQRVSNFRPSAAAIIYDTYGGEIVWDLSCGYGGRLIGAIVSPKVKHYIGTDPATKTFTGLTELAKDFAHRTQTETTLYNMGAEEYLPEPNSIDLCFTSPPYFDTEKYADETTQSFKRYPTPEQWNTGFLQTTINNCYVGLKQNGTMILNVANVKTHPTLVADTITIAEQSGFKLNHTLQLALSSISKGGFKYEPTLVFKKINIKV